MSSVPKSAKFCWSCGKTVRPNQAFCTNCGKPLNAITPPSNDLGSSTPPPVSPISPPMQSPYISPPSPVMSPDRTQILQYPPNSTPISPPNFGQPPYVASPNPTSSFNPGPYSPPSQFQPPNPYVQQNLPSPTPTTHNYPPIQNSLNQNPLSMPSSPIPGYEKIDVKPPPVVERLDKLSLQVAQYQSQLVAFASKLDRLDRIENNLSALPQWQKSVDALIQQQSVQLNVQSSDNSSKTGIDSEMLLQNLGAINHKLEYFDPSIFDLIQDKITAIESRVATLSLDSKFDQLEKRLDGLEGHLTTIIRALSQIAHRVPEKSEVSSPPSSILNDTVPEKSETKSVESSSVLKTAESTINNMDKSNPSSESNSDSSLPQTDQSYSTPEAASKKPYALRDAVYTFPDLPPFPSLNSDVGFHPTKALPETKSLDKDKDHSSSSKSAEKTLETNS